MRIEDKKRKVFLHSILAKLCLAEFSWIFERPGLDLENKRQRRQTIFAGFQKAIERVVTHKFLGPQIEIYQK